MNVMVMMAVENEENLGSVCMVQVALSGFSLALQWEVMVKVFSSTIWLRDVVLKTEMQGTGRGASGGSEGTAREIESYV